MSRQTTAARVEEICGAIAGSQGVELVDVELKGSGRNQLLRIFIDKPEGITHGDCERMSEEVGRALDGDDVVPGRYTLEVSSPGVERKLKKPAEFERFHGKKARIVLNDRAPEDLRTRFVEGKLAGVDAEAVLLEQERGGPLRIPFAAIDRANLKFEW